SSESIHQLASSLPTCVPGARRRGSRTRASSSPGARSSVRDRPDICPDDVVGVRPNAQLSARGAGTHLAQLRELMRRTSLPLVLSLVTLGCGAGTLRRFPLRDPIWRDTDLDSVAVPCRPDPKDPRHRLCTPEPYESSFAWDGADNLVFRPMTRF